MRVSGKPSVNRPRRRCIGIHIRTAAPAVAFVLLLLSPTGRADSFSTAWPAPPSVAFGELYRAVEMAGLFTDQKTFADATPKEPPPDIVATYERENGLQGFDLRAFVDRHFAPPSRHVVAFTPQPDQDVRTYIRRAWDTLTRKPDQAEPFSSLLALPHPYVVPGGRFSEIYYWDSYFVMLGLVQDARFDLARDMLDNIASLIQRYGHMPNGNRSYYLSRSQPPFFSLMVELVAAHEGDAVFVQYLPELEAEYAYWMDGAQDLQPGSAARHVVRLLTGRSSIVTGTIARHRATNPIVRTSKRRGMRAVRRRRSTATSGPGRRAAGTSARAGSPTARPSRRSARRISHPSISTPPWFTWKGHSPRPIG